MDLINSYAVVAYIPDPLAAFIKRLRQEVTPDCPHRAHITILPPRPIYGDKGQAIEQCRDIVSRFEAFDAPLGEVGLFEGSGVIKVSVTGGLAELQTLHDILNTGPFESVENFEYMPHVTVAQEIPPEHLPKCLELVRNQWTQQGPPPTVRVESLTFVQQKSDGTWTNLAELWLGRPQPVSR
jgi:2'-5' RNA ligase